MNASTCITANPYLSDPQLGKLHEIALQLAPELASAGLRLFRHEDDWPIRKGVSAYCVIGRHIAIRNTLRLRGEWLGHWGAFIVFVDRPTLGLLLHEMGHRLPAEPLIPDNIEPMAEHVAAEVAYLTREPEQNTSRKPWEGHDAAWIRRTLHLHWRAWQLGYEVGLPEMQVAGPIYGLSQPWQYMHALDDEYERMAGATFSEIEAEPMPTEFIELWRRDVKDYYRSNPELLLEQFKTENET